MRDPCLFGDYRNTLTEDPRLYEDVVDYDASKAIFEEVTNTPILQCCMIMMMVMIMIMIHDGGDDGDDDT